MLSVTIDTLCCFLLHNDNDYEFVHSYQLHLWLSLPCIRTPGIPQLRILELLVGVLMDLMKNIIFHNSKMYISGKSLSLESLVFQSEIHIM